MQNSAYTKLLKLNATDLLYIFIEVHRNVKKLELEGDWAELGPKICLLRQFPTKYLEQNEVIQ